MKRRFFFFAAVLFAGFTQAVSVSWTNRFSYASYKDNTTWGAGKNTEGNPILSLNTASTTARVYEAPDGFVKEYATETSVAALASRCQITSIVLSAPNATAWSAATYLVLKAADGTISVSQAAVIAPNSNKTFFAIGDTATSRWNPMTFVFEEPADFVPGQTYEVYLASDASGTTLVTDLSKQMLSSPDGEILFDVQLSYDPLPEPTVLALLALGLAGVALRRRIA